MCNFSLSIKGKFSDVIGVTPESSPAWAEFLRVRAAARAVLEVVQDEALAECSRVMAEAWVELERCMAEAMAEREERGALCGL